MYMIQTGHWICEVQFPFSSTSITYFGISPWRWVLEYWQALDSSSNPFERKENKGRHTSWIKLYVSPSPPLILTRENEIGICTTSDVKNHSRFWWLGIDSLDTACLVRPYLLKENSIAREVGCFCERRVTPCCVAGIPGLWFLAEWNIGDLSS